MSKTATHKRSSHQILCCKWISNKTFHTHIVGYSATYHSDEIKIMITFHCQYSLVWDKTQSLWPVVLQDLKGSHASVPASGPDVYRMDSDSKGYVCILNYSSFKDRPDLDLEGSHPDVLNLANVFGEMGYTGHAHLSLTADQTQQVLTRVRDAEVLDQARCAIFIISSHGIGEEAFLTSDMKLLTTEWIHDLFKDSECPRLKNKPKIFIFDFCCGYYKEQTPRHGRTGKCTRVEEPLRDMMCLYSSSGGFTSYSFSRDGTPFTTALCRTLAQHAHDKEFSDLYREFLKEYTKTSPATIPQLRNIGFNKRFYFSTRKYQ